MPASNTRHYLEHYLAPHPSQQVRELFLSTMLLDFASGSITLFEPIYLYTMGFSITTILLYNVGLYVTFLILLPLGAKIGQRYGYEHTILYSSPFLVLYIGALYAVKFDIGFLALALVLFAVQKVLYWPAYHSNFATFSKENEAGREVSNSYALRSFAAVLAPLFGGVVIAFLGFTWLFVISSVLILLSNIPMIRTPDLAEPREFPYFKAFARLRRRKNRRKLFTYFGWGHEFIAMVLWPLFIIKLLGSTVSLGAVVSLAMLVNVFVTLYVGRLTDEEEPSRVLRVGVVYSTASWLVRPLITGGLGIFLIDAFYRVSTNTLSVPMMTMLYEDGHKKNDAMEEVVFMEMSLALGKLVVIGLCVLSFALFPDNWLPIFGIAAVFTAMLGLMPPSGKEKV
ncbi:MFS transporter [Patescibacteria group bacterium]